MSIFIILLKKYWKHLIILLLLISLCIYGYKAIYNIGYSASQVECKQQLSAYEEKMLQYKKSLDDRIKTLEETSISLVKETQIEKLEVRKDIAKIITVYKDKPLVVIEKEKCTPSSNFIAAYNEAVARVNK